MNYACGYLLGQNVRKKSGKNLGKVYANKVPGKYATKQTRNVPKN